MMSRDDVAPKSCNFSPFTTGRAALQAVALPDGMWNWVLIGADPEALPLVAGGGGSIDEMRSFLHLNRNTVVFGILRVSCGSGRLQRTKHVLVHAVGEDTPVILRGRLNMQRARMRAVLSEFVESSLTIELSRSHDLSSEFVMERLRSTVIVDDDVLTGANIEAIFPMTSRGSENHTVPYCSVGEALRAVSTSGGRCNWALFAPSADFVRSPRVTAPPPLLSQNGRPMLSLLPSCVSRQTWRHWHSCKAAVVCERACETPVRRWRASCSSLAA